MLGDDRQQLRVDVAPFAHAAHVDEVLAQQLLVLAIAQLVRIAMPAARVADPVPQPQVAAELALLVVELRVGLVGLRLRFERAVAHVLHAERAGDHQHFVQCAATARLKDHASDPRVERQARQFGAGRRQLVGIVDRAQFVEQLIAVGDGAALRCLEERKALDVTEVQRLHAQDDARQRRAQDLRVGESRPRFEILFVVEPDADAVRHAAAAARTLVGGPPG